MLNENKQLDLYGFSGNKIEVIRLGGETFVRKTAKDMAHNIKMEKEIIKIEELQKISKINNNFKVPKIRSVKKNQHGFLVYELEFIPGESLDNCLYNLSSKKIKFFAKKLGEIINEISSKYRENKIDEKEFLLKKFNELNLELHKKKNSTKIGKELFNEYNKKIKELEIKETDLTNKSTFCHGDLALDNILITKKDQIYLIDPLHNGFESVMWDYAKILQSSMTYWNLIKYQNFQLMPNYKKIIISHNEHISMFHKHFLKNLSSINSSTILLYLAATLARVAKYAKTDKQLFALIIIINELLSDYSNGKCNLDGSLNSLRW
jgi:thiamine kinase-like enzyme